METNEIVTRLRLAVERALRRGDEAESEYRARGKSWAGLRFATAFGVLESEVKFLADDLEAQR